MKLDIKFNFNKVHAKIDKMRDKMTNLEPLMEEIGEEGL